ncbi:MAG: M67 family metallopeptidase [Novosphingobium sp.]
MGMAIEVTSGVIATLLEEAQKAAPHECCGLLMGTGARIEEARAAANIDPEPHLRFEIAPAALIAAHREARAGGRAVLGYYHSHPAGHPVPSATDCAHSCGDNRVWAIIAGGEVRFWRDTANGFAALSYSVVDG